MSISYEEIIFPPGSNHYGKKIDKNGNFLGWLYKPNNNKINKEQTFNTIKSYLSKWERTFMDKMIKLTDYSPKQKEVIKKILDDYIAENVLSKEVYKYFNLE